MVEFFKIMEDEKRATYKYIPCTHVENGSPDYGIIHINKETGDCDIEKFSSLDVPIKMFVNKVLPRLVGFWKKGQYQDEGSVYWC